MKPRHAEQINSVFDSDGSGQIDYGEFVQFLECEDLDEAIRKARGQKGKKKKKNGSRI